MASIADLIKGLQILVPENQDGEHLSAEHDVIYVWGREDIDDTAHAELHELGFFWDEDRECWATFT